MDEKIYVFSKIILDIFKFNNFIPHETLIFDEKDPPYFRRSPPEDGIQQKWTFSLFCKNCGYGKNNFFGRREFIQF